MSENYVATEPVVIIPAGMVCTTPKERLDIVLKRGLALLWLKGVRNEP